MAECSICYAETGSFVKLCCSHEFCPGCIKSWYQKGTGTGCPMCRRPMYWKGFHKAREQWDQEAYEIKSGEVFIQSVEDYATEAFSDLNNAIEEISTEAESAEEASFMACEFIEQLCDDDDFKPIFKALNAMDSLETKKEVLDYFRKWVMNDLMKDIIKMEKTLRFLKSEKVDTDTIDEILYYMEYYSDRGINRWTWHDEPIKEQEPRYPSGGGGRCGKRARALEDPWSEMSFYLVVNY